MGPLVVRWTNLTWACGLEIRALDHGQHHREYGFLLASTPQSSQLHLP